MQGLQQGAGCLAILAGEMHAWGSVQQCISVFPRACFPLVSQNFLNTHIFCFELAFGLEVNFLKRKLVVLVWMKALYIGMPPYLIVK